MNDLTVSSEIKAKDAANSVEVWAGDFLEKARAVVVASAGDATVAAGQIKTLADRAKALDGERRAITIPLDESKKRVMDLFRRPLAVIDEAQKVLRGKVLAFQVEQDRLARAEQARLDEIARKEREKLEKRAAAAAAKGQDEKAADLMDRADEAALVPQIVTEKVGGASVRRTWVGEVLSVQELAAAVASGVAPVSFFKVDQSAVDAYARATNGGMEVPGIRFSQKAGLSVR